MLGSFAEAEDLVQDTVEKAWKSRETYQGTAPVERWLYAIATNGCLNVLAQRRRRGLPQLEQGPAGNEYQFGETEPERWITPAPDERLFPDPSEVAEARETVALAFMALLQRIPARQRAALLLKDVVGWSADEIAEALGLTVPSVNSAIHRGREGVARVPPRAEEPLPETVRAFVRAWETRDLEALVALLREDVTLAMPPYALWFRGVDAVVGFLRTPGFSAFWSSVERLDVTRANGLPAVVFQRRLANGQSSRHSVMVVRFEGERVAEMTTFIGPDLLQTFP
jgi:RNA polymerase sigma-70 factor (ECF subfamily)